MIQYKMGGSDKCPDCVSVYSIVGFIFTFGIISCIFKIILFYYSEKVINDYIEDIETTHSYDSNDSNTNSTDIILPKYVNFDELNEDEIEYTVPPKYTA